MVWLVVSSSIVFSVAYFQLQGIAGETSPGVLLVLLSLTKGQLSSSLWLAFPVSPMAIRLIRGGFSAIFLYEFISVGELLSSLLGVECCEFTFSAVGPRTLYLWVCTGFRPGMVDGGARRNADASGLESWTSISAGWCWLFWFGDLSFFKAAESSFVCGEEQMLSEPV